MSKVCMFLANGFEEVEGLTVVDIVRRAGVTIDMLSITGSTDITSSHNVSLKADMLAEDADISSYDMIVLPGGMPGTNNLKSSELVRNELKKAYEAGKYVAAICAAPSVLSDLGLLKGKDACCYVSFEDTLKNDGANVLRDEVVVADNVITSRGLGTAIPFGLKLVEILCGKTEADRISDSIMFRLA